MKNLKMKLGLIALALSLMIAANAQPGNGKGNGNGYGNGYGKKGQNSEFKGNCQGGYLKAALDLSDEQETQIQKLRTTHQKAMLPLMNELKEKKAQLTTLQTTDKADIKAINSKIDEIAVVKTKMAKAKASHQLEVRNLLTEEQRLQFDLHAINKGNGKGKGPGCNNR